MTLPHFRSKYGSPGVLKAADLISHGGRWPNEVLRGANAAILCLESISYDYLTRRFSGKRADEFTGEVVSLKKTDYRVAAARPPGPGAPSAAVMIEELISGGVNRFIALGVAGALQSSVKAGDVILPTGALRDEGTSYHYLPDDVQPAPDEDLFTMLRTFMMEMEFPTITGKIWTTDAPYRETAGEIYRYQDEGLLAVDMETSAVLSVACALNVRLVCVLVAADSLSTGTWAPPDDYEAVRKSLRKVAEASVKVLAS